MNTTDNKLEKVTLRGRNGGKLRVPPKGMTANPKGKPKGTLSAKTVITRWLEMTENVKNPVTGQFEDMTQLDVITLAQLKKARAGNTIAFNALLDRFSGRPTQEIQNTGAGGEPLPAPQVLIIENH